MPTVVNKPEPEDREFVHQISVGAYLDGDCYVFAIALHRGLGWPLIGLMHNGEIRHAAVKKPDGKLFDVRGFVEGVGFGEYFRVSHPYSLQKVTEDDLLRDCESFECREQKIQTAQKTAEYLWPDLPWKNTRKTNMLKFVEELEKLSRKHGFWISAPIPTARPMITDGYGDEFGYELFPNQSGMGFTIDRKLND